MRALWLAMQRHLSQLINNPPPEGINAATLAVIRAWLRDNGINARTLTEQQEGLRRLTELSASFADLPD
jgi:hypothetical protein